MVPVSVDPQIQVWPAVFAVWSAHAEHLRSKLPSMIEQLLWHGSWQQSEEARNVLRHDNASYYLH